MNRKTINFLLLLATCIGTVHAQDTPRTKISNGIIKALLYLPNSDNGYYRGSRFDWSGVTASLEYKGHSYFSVWNPLPYDPRLHDAIVGPVEEFRSPLGYDEAKVGQSFVKIGVGGLKKIQETSYRFGFSYEIINGGKWTVRQQKDQVVFTHELSDPSGYAYVYTKTVQLIKGKPMMLLQHSLKNTGKKSMESSVYNHNFFVIDKEPTGPNIKTTFPFNLTVEEGGTGLRGFGTIAKIQGNSILYNRPLEKGETVFSNALLGFKPVPEDYNITIQNTKTRAGVRITSDSPMEKLVYWACPTTACPEPYIKINVPPGGEVKWKYLYEFFVSD